jgi:hypothetical protein
METNVIEMETYPRTHYNYQSYTTTQNYKLGWVLLFIFFFVLLIVLIIWASQPTTTTNGVTFNQEDVVVDKVHEDEYGDDKEHPSEPKQEVKDVKQHKQEKKIEVDETNLAKHEDGKKDSSKNKHDSSSESSNDTLDTKKNSDISSDETDSDDKLSNLTRENVKTLHLGDKTETFSMPNIEAEMKKSEKQYSSDFSSPNKHGDLIARNDLSNLLNNKGVNSIDSF